MAFSPIYRRVRQVVSSGVGHEIMGINKKARGTLHFTCFGQTSTLFGAKMSSAILEAASDQQIEKRIQKHRTATTRLTIKTAKGVPLANQAVTIRQTNHAFLFGCNIFPLKKLSTPALEEGFQKRFAELLNYATVPFYWSGYEREEGQTQAARLKEMATWCVAHDIRVKGHTLVYHQTIPEWSATKSFAEFKRLQLERVTREVKEFAGLIDIWDVTNETCWAPGHLKGQHPVAKLTRKMGRVGIVKEAYGLARKANPKATLVLNDCDPTPLYAKLVRESLAAKAAVDVVGIQSHMHKGYWGLERAWKVCEQYAKFGRPLHFSELTILSGILQKDHSWALTRTDWFSTAEGEELQAKQVRDFYRLLFSHPAVAGITWWDFADEGAWLGAPAGLVRKDMSPKPAYEELYKLIKKDWWTPEQKLMTDAKGVVEFAGFLGAHEVQVKREKVAFSVDKAGKGSAVVRVKA